MRIFLFITLAALLVTRTGAQTSFSPVDSKLAVTKNGDLTELVCSGVGISVKFQLKREVTVSPLNNVLNIDGHAILITPLKFSGFAAINDEKLLLDTYSKYQLDYFKNDLKVELVNSSNQWVQIKSKGWFIWYFKVGNVPVKVDKQTKIQLFASTIVGNNILTINAPVLNDGDDFTKAGLIVNDMMESMTITK